MINKYLLNYFFSFHINKGNRRDCQKYVLYDILNKPTFIICKNNKGKSSSLLRQDIGDEFIEKNI